VKLHRIFAQVGSTNIRSGRMTGIAETRNISTKREKARKTYEQG
jgi:hypothetical protein